MEPRTTHMDAPADVIAQATQEAAVLSSENRVPVKKLDLSQLSAPDNLEEARLESMTIDGICGVY